MTDRAHHAATPYTPAQETPRPTQPLWWYHRHLNADQFTDLVGAIIDAELDRASDQAALEADTTHLYLTDRARTALIAQATRGAEDQLRREGAAAVEHYIAARQAHTEQLRHQHIRAHGCGAGCNTIRGRT